LGYRSDPGGEHAHKKNLDAEKGDSYTEIEVGKQESKSKERESRRQKGSSGKKATASPDGSVAFFAPLARVGGLGTSVLLSDYQFDGKFMTGATEENAYPRA
jgi:hypothetical protein